MDSNILMREIVNGEINRRESVRRNESEDIIRTIH